jgi:hypothetical protein
MIFRVLGSNLSRHSVVTVSTKPSLDKVMHDVALPVDVTEYRIGRSVQFVDTTGIAISIDGPQSTKSLGSLLYGF